MTVKVGKYILKMNNNSNKFKEIMINRILIKNKIIFILIKVKINKTIL
jgi:hypothetical protein